MGLIKWWKHWEICRFFLISFLTVILGFLSAYFIPIPYGIIGVFVILGIGAALLWKYRANFVEKLIQILLEDDE